MANSLKRTQSIFSNKLLANTLLALMLSAMLTPAFAQFGPYPRHILVITSDALAITGLPAAEPDSPQVDIYSLDAVGNAEEVLSVLLPADEEQALAMLQQRIAEIGQARLEEDLANAYKALATAMSYDLDRYPAMIFDEEVVIYGLTDVTQATQIYQDWLRDEQGSAAHE